MASRVGGNFLAIGVYPTAYIIAYIIACDNRNCYLPALKKKKKKKLSCPLRL